MERRMTKERQRALAALLERLDRFLDLPAHKTQAKEVDLAHDIHGFLADAKIPKAEIARRMQVSAETVRQVVYDRTKGRSVNRRFTQGFALKLRKALATLGPLALTKQVKYRRDGR